MTYYVKYGPDGEAQATGESDTAAYGGFEEVDEQTYLDAVDALENRDRPYSVGDWVADRQAGNFTDDSEALDRLAEALE